MMKNGKVEIVIKPMKFIVIVLIVVIIATVFIFGKSKPKNITKIVNDKEVVLPRETGVVDSGFEGSFSDFTVLNAQTSIDKDSKIDGVSSLKINFSEKPLASVKLANYFNNIQEGSFYRLSFWTKNNLGIKNISVNVAEKENVQRLGKLKLKTNLETVHQEVNFQARNYANDLIFVSDDGVVNEVWIDDVILEKLNVSSKEELQNLKPTISGETTWRNIDQEQQSESEDSGDFLATSGRKIGQLFQPQNKLISGISLLIQRKGNGGLGNYQIQIKEYNSDLGIVGNDLVASREFYFGYSADDLDVINKKEKQMRNDAASLETAIKDGKIADSTKLDYYPNNITSEQIDTAKAKIRADKLAVAIKDMKETFNSKMKIEIPFSAKLDTSKKYWIGIDNSTANTDQNNYIKIFSDDSKGKTGLISEVENSWKSYSKLSIGIYQPKFTKINENNVLNGATISDLGDKLVYRYGFDKNDYSSASSFNGRKINNLFSGEVESTDLFGNYTLKGEKYALYKFDTIFPISKVIIRDGLYDDSLRMEFSSDAENWKEIFSENSAEKEQTINSLVVYPDLENNVFYLRLSATGEFCSPLGLNVEAELKK